MSGIHDNMRTAVDRIGRSKDRQVSARFSAMASYLFGTESAIGLRARRRVRLGRTFGMPATVMATDAALSIAGGAERLARAAMSGAVATDHLMQEIAWHLRDRPLRRIAIVGRRSGMIMREWQTKFDRRSHGTQRASMICRERSVGRLSSLGDLRFANEAPHHDSRQSTVFAHSGLQGPN